MPGFTLHSLQPATMLQESTYLPWRELPDTFSLGSRAPHFLTYFRYAQWEYSGYSEESTIYSVVPHGPGETSMRVTGTFPHVWVPLLLATPSMGPLHESPSSTRGRKVQVSSSLSASVGPQRKDHFHPKIQKLLEQILGKKDTHLSKGL